jgi:hypothetical protein
MIKMVANTSRFFIHYYSEVTVSGINKMQHQKNSLLNKIAAAYIRGSTKSQEEEALL